MEDLDIDEFLSADFEGARGSSGEDEEDAGEEEESASDEEEEDAEQQQQQQQQHPIARRKQPSAKQPAVANGKGSGKGSGEAEEEEQAEEAEAAAAAAGDPLAQQNLRLRGEVSEHKAALEALRQQDPEFYEYLQVGGVGAAPRWFGEFGGMFVGVYSGCRMMRV